jgi:hypothetical protein
MDDTDRKIRRWLLRPLTPRSQRAFDSKAYLEALRRLDDRAIGEDGVRQMVELRSSIDNNSLSGNWKDPVHAKRNIVLAKLLYASRRISKHEYVIMAVSPAEAVHQGRWLDGRYDDDLGPINQSLRRIEREHGLGPDQYWLRGEGPQEHIDLTKQYSAILDAKFRETLRELGLDDLATMLEQSREEFDRLRERGRRSLFHKDEYILAVQDVVVQYEKEARQAAAIGAYSVAVTALGAGVEGLLLLRCLRSRHKASRIAKGLPKRLRPPFPDDLSKWRFETLIEVCLKAGWLRPIETSIAVYDTASMAHVLRLMRNYVHPGRRARKKPWSVTDEQEYRDADAIYVVLISTLGNIRRAHRSPDKKPQ